MVTKPVHELEYDHFYKKITINLVILAVVSFLIAILGLGWIFIMPILKKQDPSIMSNENYSFFIFLEVIYFVTMTLSISSFVLNITYLATPKGTKLLLAIAIINIFLFIFVFIPTFLGIAIIMKLKEEKFSNNDLIKGDKKINENKIVFKFIKVIMIIDFIGIIITFSLVFSSVLDFIMNNHFNDYSLSYKNASLAILIISPIIFLFEILVIILAQKIWFNPLYNKGMIKTLIFLSIFVIPPLSIIFTILETKILKKITSLNISEVKLVNSEAGNY